MQAVHAQGGATVAWVRSAERARAQLGAQVELLETGAGSEALAAALGGCDGVVNLAGEPLLARRWTPAVRRGLRDSRVGVTTALVAALEHSRPRPRVLVSGSAVGLYGDRGGEVLTEASAPGSDYLAELCRDWEAAAAAAIPLGLCVVHLRTGVVLGRRGGALRQMLPPFRLGLGGPIAGGRQYMAWIHLQDIVGIITAALADARYQGAINAVAPQAATNREFTRALGAALHRPALVPLPALALRARFGAAASVLLASQRAVPQALTTLGFPFAFPALAPALAEAVG